MRLIDADALWKEFDTAHLFDNGNPRHIAQRAVEDAPTVDIKTEVAKEIFAEIEMHIQAELKTLSIFDEDEDDFYTGEKFGLEEISKKIAELKNKYTEVNK
jgi:hypothetical protein